MSAKKILCNRTTRENERGDFKIFSPGMEIGQMISYVRSARFSSTSASLLVCFSITRFLAFIGGWSRRRPAPGKFAALHRFSNCTRETDVPPRNFTAIEHRHSPLPSCIFFMHAVNARGKSGRKGELDSKKVARLSPVSLSYLQRDENFYFTYTPLGVFPGPSIFRKYPYYIRGVTRL